MIKTFWCVIVPKSVVAVVTVMATMLSCSRWIRWCCSAASVINNPLQAGRHTARCVRRFLHDPAIQLLASHTWSDRKLSPAATAFCRRHRPLVTAAGPGRAGPGSEPSSIRISRRDMAHHITSYRPSCARHAWLAHPRHKPFLATKSPPSGTRSQQIYTLVERPLSLVAEA